MASARAIGEETQATSACDLDTIIPLAECPECGGAAAFPQEYDHTGLCLSENDSPERVFEALGGWVNPRTGIVSRIALEATGTDLVIATTAPLYLMKRRFPIGWGKGLTLSGAILSAVGEAIERYSASLPDPSRIVWKRPSELDGERLDPREFALYTAAQYERDEFPFVQFDPEIPHPWVRGKWLASGDPVWVPAVFAYLSLTLEREQNICQGSSNGLAAAWTWEEAALRATLELVERDAFMTAWLEGRAGQRIDIDAAHDSRLRQIVESVEQLGADIELYVLPSACATVIAAMAFGADGRYPGVTLGLGAGLDPASAMRAAILELGQTGPHLCRMMQPGGWHVPASPQEVREMPDHAAYYFPRERARAFDRLRTHEAYVSSPPRERSLAIPADIRVALVDVTSADVALGPFRVVRAVSPDLQPISYGYGLDRAPVKRIRLATGLPEIHPIW